MVNLGLVLVFLKLLNMVLLEYLIVFLDGCVIGYLVIGVIFFIIEYFWWFKVVDGFEVRYGLW